MRAGEGGAPPRAGSAPRVARYGAWWRARDMARSARWWLGQGEPGRLRLVGALYLVLGLLLLLATAIVPGMRHWDAAYMMGGGLCLIGFACLRARRVP